MTIVPGLRIGSYEITAQARRGRHGRGLARHRHEAEARGRDQGAARGLHRGQGPSGPLRARGADPRFAEPSEHRLDSRPRRRRWRPRPGHGARRRRRPVGPHGVRTDARRRGAKDRAPDRRGARGGPREGNRPPRPQAPERQGHARGESEGPRLRPRQGDGPIGDRRLRGRPRPLADDGRLPHAHRNARHADGRDPRHRGLHGTGAGTGQAGRPAGRHLGVRRSPLRDAHGATPLRGGDRQRHARRGAPAGGRLEPAAEGPRSHGPAAPRAVPRAGPETPSPRHRRGAARPRASSWRRRPDDDGAEARQEPRRLAPPLRRCRGNRRGVRPRPADGPFPDGARPGHRAPDHARHELRKRHQRFRFPRRPVRRLRGVRPGAPEPLAAAARRRPDASPRGRPARRLLGARLHAGRERHLLLPSQRRRAARRPLLDLDARRGPEAPPGRHRLHGDLLPRWPPDRFRAPATPDRRGDVARRGRRRRVEPEGARLLPLSRVRRRDLLRGTFVVAGRPPHRHRDRRPGRRGGGEPIAPRSRRRRGREGHDSRRPGLGRRRAVRMAPRRTVSPRHRPRERPAEHADLVRLVPRRRGPEGDQRPERPSDHLADRRRPDPRLRGREPSPRRSGPPPSPAPDEPGG